MLSLLVQASRRRNGLRERDDRSTEDTGIALLIFAPVIAWNSTHGWISFAFQLQHGLGAPKGSALTREVNLLGGQLGLVSPILAVMLGIVVVRALRSTRSTRSTRRTTAHGADTQTNDRQFALAAIVATMLVFFMLSALRKPVEANWPAPALIAALPLLALWDVDGESHTAARRWFTAGVALAALCSLVVCAHALLTILPLSARRDPIAKAYGWDHVAARVDSVRDSLMTQHSACRRVWIAADRYQDASELAFYLQGTPTVFSLNLGGRHNQYDLWPPLHTARRDDDCVLVVVDDNDAGARIARRAVGGMHGGPAQRSLGVIHDAGPITLTRLNTPTDHRHLWILSSR